MTADIRRQVRAEILGVMASAKAEGRDELKAAHRTFPGVPDSLLYELSGELLCEEEEAWWQKVERTIDGEVIRNAIGKAAES